MPTIEPPKGISWQVLPGTSISVGMSPGSLVDELIRANSFGHSFGQQASVGGVAHGAYATAWGETYAAFFSSVSSVGATIRSVMSVENMEDLIAGSWSTIAGAYDTVIAAGSWMINDGLDQATNFFAGWADLFTLGGSRWLREATGTDYVDYSSWTYTGGQVSATVVGIGIGFGGVGAVGAAGTAARGITSFHTIGGMGIAIGNVYNGEASAWDALAFAPLLGRGLGTAYKSFAPNSVATGGWHKATGGKWISLDDAGGAIRPLSNDKIKFTDLGIDYLKDHLSRFKSPSGGMWDHNAAMINDLRKIARGELEATQIHRNFYSHELREMTRLRRLGSTSGPVDPFDYANTHYATLFEYGIPWGDHGSYLYTRFARTFFPGGF